MVSNQTAGGPAVDYDSDRYPLLKDAIARILDEEDLPELQVERLELTALANGECNYRYWTPRAEEPEGGHMPSSEPSL